MDHNACLTYTMLDSFLCTYLRVVEVTEILLTMSAAESSSLFLTCGSQSNEAVLHIFVIRTHEVTVKKLYSWLRWRQF